MLLQVVERLEQLGAFVKEDHHRQVLAERGAEDRGVVAEELLPVGRGLLEVAHAEHGWANPGEPGLASRRLTVSPSRGPVGRHGRQQRLFEAAQGVHAGGRVPGEQGVGPSLLAAVGVVPDDALRLGLEEGVGRGSARGSRRR